MQTNVRCGAKVTSGEIVEDQPLYRSCPASTYGQYINIIGTGSTATQLKLCDVVVHKRTSRSFDYIKYILKIKNKKCRSRSKNDYTK